MGFVLLSFKTFAFFVKLIFFETQHFDALCQAGKILLETV